MVQDTVPAAKLNAQLEAQLELKGSVNMWRFRRVELLAEDERGEQRLRLYERQQKSGGGAQPRPLAEYLVRGSEDVPDRAGKRAHRFDVRVISAREQTLCFAAEADERTSFVPITLYWTGWGSGP